MASPKGKLDIQDVRSSLRHFVLPVIAGAILAGLEVAQSGVLNWSVIQTAAVTAAIAGVARLLQRWMKENV